MELYCQFPTPLPGVVLSKQHGQLNFNSQEMGSTFTKDNSYFIKCLSTYFLETFLIILDYFRILQVITSVFSICIFVGFISLYCTLVCVACSQLEKLKAALLCITQTYVTSELNCGTETGEQQGQGQCFTSENVFWHIQKQLNACIRHHQDIKRCGYSQD